MNRLLVALIVVLATCHILFQSRTLDRSQREGASLNIMDPKVRVLSNENEERNHQETGKHEKSASTDESSNKDVWNNASRHTTTANSYENTFLELIGPSDKRLPILEAKYFLVWLDVPENVTRDTTYEGVRCSFCPVNWEKQKETPNMGMYFCVMGL